MLGDLLKKIDRTCSIDRSWSSISIEDICVDSRQAGHGSMFIAIPGTRVKGSKFIEHAVRRGASAAVVPQEEFASMKMLMPPGFPLIPMPDIRCFAGHAADIFYGKPSTHLRLVGITGTNGKTTVAWLLESILSAANFNPGIIGTISRRFKGMETDSSLTTPDAVSLQRSFLEMMNAGVDSCLLEVSSHALHQKRVAGCRFNVAVFTNLSHDHLDYHRDIEEYFQAKRLLFSEYLPETAVINLDDQYGRKLVEELAACNSSSICITYGMHDADVTPHEYTLTLSGTTAVIKTPAGMTHISSRLAGLHNLYNIMAAVAAAYAMGINPDAVSKGIDAVSKVPGRLEPVDVPPGYTALVDYAHTPDAIEKVLQNLKRLVPGRLITVAGCGGDRDRRKRPLMAGAAARYSDLLFLTSDNPRTEEPKDILWQMAEGLDPLLVKAAVKIVPQRKHAVSAAVTHMEKGDCLLVAGKGHETCQIIGKQKIYFDDREVISAAFHDDTPAGHSGDRMVDSKSSSSLFPHIKTADIARVAGAIAIYGKTDKKYCGVSTDTRSIKKGELFWALTGKNFDGNLFASQALESGASGVVVAGKAMDYLNPDDFPHACIIAVDDTLEALGKFAAWYRERCGLKVVGITGSCGKTGTRSMVTSVISTMFPVVETIGNFNNLIGLPLSILSTHANAMWGIFEMGMNQPGEIMQLCGIALPDVGLITNIKPAHLEGLGDINAIAAEKWELWKALPVHGTAVVNLDDPLILRGVSHLKCLRLIGYSSSAMDREDTYPADLLHGVVFCDSWTPHGPGSKVVCILKTRGSSERLCFNLPLAGEANVHNALAAVAVGLALHLPAAQIKEGIESAPCIPGRFEYRELPSGTLLIRDLYNANPGSMQAALQGFEKWSYDRPRVALLGDMLELGEHAVPLHLEAGRQAADIGLDLLLAAGRYAHALKTGAVSQGMAEKDILTFTNTEELCAWLRENGAGRISLSSAILVKGSRGMMLEKAADILEDIYSNAHGTNSFQDVRARGE